MPMTSISRVTNGDSARTTTTRVRSRPGSPPSVRQVTLMTSAMEALDIHCLLPLRTSQSPSRVSRVAAMRSAILSLMIGMLTTPVNSSSLKRP